MWHVACMEGSDVDAVLTDHETWGPGDLKRVEYGNLFVCLFFSDLVLDLCHGIWE